LKPAIGRLRSAYNDVLRLESRRRKKVEALRDNARRDDIKPDILKEAARLERTYPNTALVPAHFEEFFDQRLDRLYEPEVEAIEKEAQDQDRLLQDVQRVNREFESQKRQMGERGNREREIALQRLDNAYFKYKEIINNLEVGRKFYNDLNKIVGQGFRDVIRNWVAQRRMEARALEEEINMPTLSNLNISHQQAQAQSHVHAQSSMPSHQEPAHSYAPPQQPPQPVQSPAQANIQSWGETMQQPKPVQPQQAAPMWNPGMGIKFGQSSGGSGQPPAPGTWNPNAGIKFG
jgi:programmed cell death 6-interacting protein